MGSELSHCTAICTHVTGKENEAILVDNTSTMKKVPFSLYVPSLFIHGKTHKSIDPDFVKKTTMDQTIDSTTFLPEFH